MKKISLILVLFIAGFATGQSNETELTDNQKRLSKIPDRIQEAVASEDYQQAANLKDEMAIRRKMEQANSSGNYDRLFELEKELAECECRPQPIKECAEEEIVEKPKDYGPDPFSFYLEFMPAAYVHTGNTQRSYLHGGPDQPSGDVTQRVKKDRFAGGLRLGSSIYFGDMDKDLKVGLDLLYGAVTLSTGSFDIFSGGPRPLLSMAHPGVVVTKYLNNKSGFDFKVNAGMSLLFHDNSYGGFNDFMGISATGKVKYWIKHFAVGVEYQYGNSLSSSDFNYNQIGFNIGMRF